MKGVYSSTVGIFGVVSIGLGIALIIETAVEGGGVGYILGLLFLALGAGRLYLLRRRK
jgi:hypothetical protein